ncbi:competence type IV pilus assembly protein ComGB [Jeotgalibacillus proteolyticus]|uniref:competence type IV pilus assembly protein ComGB n=1 Tax=Jeotgalibacillus proteolyticus TaxID=2082395 RepID=UPI003CFA8F5B
MPKHQGPFLKKLGELKGNGYPLDRAIEFLLLSQQVNLSAIHHEVLKDFLNGHSLSDTLKKLGFPSFVCLHIYFAERFGNVEATLADTAVLMEHKRKETRRLAKLLHYPLFLFCLFLVILTVLNLYLLPRFTTLYSSLGQDSNGLVSVISSMFSQLPYIVAGVAMLCLLFGAWCFYYFRTKDSHERWTTLAGIPFIGYYVQHYHSYVFSREASYLMKGGMSFQEMLNVFVSQPYRKLYHYMGEFISDELSRGQSMHQTLLQLPYLTEELKSITEHGEENGQLEEEWLFYSRYCLNSLEERTEKIFSFIQPCLFGLLGLAIIGAYLVILLPLFQIMQTI